MIHRKLSPYTIIKYIYLYIHRVSKRPVFYILNNSVKTESISIILVYYILRKFHIRKL